ncbi:MAG: hypothetical protein KDD73_09745 [Anaerolineales bacterium]|nr:hypothetical protein [Anaerolineales bacterium]MCB9128638.1 hypothetical protein [Ardenticatenales bacterium]
MITTKLARSVASLVWLVAGLVILMSVTYLGPRGGSPSLGEVASAWALRAWNLPIRLFPIYYVGVPVTLWLIWRWIRRDGRLRTYLLTGLLLVVMCGGLGSVLNGLFSSNAYVDTIRYQGETYRLTSRSAARDGAHHWTVWRCGNLGVRCIAINKGFSADVPAVGDNYVALSDMRLVVDAQSDQLQLELIDGVRVPIEEAGS